MLAVRNPQFPRFLVALAALSLACSGGGGSSDDGRAAITQGDSEEIAGTVMRAAFMSEDVGDVSDGAIPDNAGAAKQVGSEGGRDVPQLATRAPFGPTASGCETSGTVTLSGDVDTPGDFAVGDQVRAVFALCDDDNGFVFDGVYDLTVTALTGDLLGSDFDATLDLDLEGFQADDGSLLVFDGDAVLDYDVSTPQLTVIGLAGTSLDIDEGPVSYDLRSYDIDLSVDEAPDPDEYTLSADGRMTSSEFAGEVQFETTTPFQGTGMDPPTSGEMVITGANDATLTIDPQGGDDVDLFLDFDGNGNPDVVVGTTWTALGL